MLAAVEKGDVKELAEVVRQDPNMDHDGDGHASLHLACTKSSRSPLIPLLLAHPDIDVNLKDTFGWTPFFWACRAGHPSCVREMLKDSRVDVNEPDFYGRTPLWRAASSGHLDAIQWWIASGREMDLGTPGDVDQTDAIGKANKIEVWHSAADRRHKTEIATLLERFQSDAAQTRHQVRVELCWYDKAAAEMFALAVFASDGLLQTKDVTSTPAARYYSIARKLPLELQMVLCFRQVDSTKEIIPGKDSEVAFKSLAESLLWPSIFTN